MHKMNRQYQKMVFDAILGKKDIIQLLNKTKGWPEYEINQMLTLIMSKKTKSTQALIRSLFPKNYSELCPYKRFKFDMTCNIENIIGWYTEIIKCFAKEIVQYQELKASYYNYLFNSNYSEAREKFEIIKSIGCSLWSLENEFILAEYEDGLEKNKNELSKFETMGCSVWITFFANLFSFKAEKGITNRQYLYRIERVLEGTPSEIAAFVEEKMFPIDSIKVNLIKEILLFNSGTSIFDIFDSFIRMGTWVMCSDEINVSTKDLFSDAFSGLAGINNPTIKKILFNEKSYTLTDIDKRMYDIGNDYTEGKYETAIANCRDIFSQEGIFFEAIEYFVKSHIMLNLEIGEEYDGSILGDLISAMYNSYLHNAEVKKSLDDLFRIERIASNVSMGSAVASFIIDKYTTDLAEVQNRIKEYQSPFLNIKFGIERCGGNTVSQMATLFKEGSSLDLFLANENREELTNCNIEYNRQRWYYLKSLLDISLKICELEKWYEEIRKNEDSFSVYMTERIATEGRVELGDAIVADCSWDYGSGKIELGEGGFVLSPDPRYISIDPRVRAVFAGVDRELMYKLRTSWNMKGGKRINSDTNVYVGSLPSGAAVIQTEELVSNYIELHNRKMLGLDMETYAVYYAAENAPTRPLFVSIKSVSDYANSKKNDDYQAYASYISIRLFLEKLPELMSL